MFRFFLPASKVQKDRRIMRETDERMAKYSRRGLIVNFFAFLVCLAPGQFVEQNAKLMVVLTVGLLAITLLRGFYLFRFDSFYPRAPAKWRNRYFVATLIGAIWWSVILVSVTLELQMKYEAPLLWLYTVIFFSSTAHAFAPYQKFLSYYQFFGQIPAAAAAIYLNDLNGYLYGAMMLAFYLVLTHQCRLMSENYWERLEATYALARKTLSIEEEKRDTKANVKLNQQFIRHLNSDIDRFIQNIEPAENTTIGEYKCKIQRELSELYKNIHDFNGVLSKELVMADKVFNIRHEIQHLVAEFVDQAEYQNIQIETSLSPTLPMRLKGDASRLAQIIRALLNIILKDAEKCIVLVEVEFLREYETAGELYVSVTRSFDKNKKLFFGESSAKNIHETLALVVAKGIADLMNGSIEVNESIGDYQQLRFNAKIDIAERAGQLDFHKDSFAGKNVLLVNNHPRIVDIKRQELDALGFNVFTETQYKRAVQTLQNSYKFQTPIESLIFYLEPDNDAVDSFCEALHKIPELKYTFKIASATRRQQDQMRSKGYVEKNGFYYVDKPTGLFEIECIFHQIYQQREGDNENIHAKEKQIRVAMLIDKESMESSLVKKSLSLHETIELVDSSNDFIEVLRTDNFQILMIDCDCHEDIADLVDKIREYEHEGDFDNYMPVIGLSLAQEELEDKAYELGLDDYIDLTHNSKKTLKSTISYWSTLIS